MASHSPLKNVWYLCVLLLALNPLLLACDSRPPFACGGATSSLPFCQTSLRIRDRVSDLIKRLTLQEKIRLLVNNATGVERLGISGYEWWSEALHGVAYSGPGVTFGGEFPAATSFPQVITTAASHNATLWEAIGQAVSNEARAMYNWDRAGLTYWSPNVNIFRDPRWGRGQETPGEDPTIAAQYAISYVKGLQGNGAGNGLKVAACCKHYTAYDLDSWNGADRFHFNAKVTKQDLEDTYNVPFKACVTQANVASVMCSYNQVNGKPTCADPNLLRGTIRSQWRLRGYIVSDCDSVAVFFGAQRYTNSPEDAAADAIKAGLDLNCGSFLAIHTDAAIRSGKLAEADVDRALTNLLRVQMRLGMFDGSKQSYLHLGQWDVCTQAHKNLALEAAQQGIVLLKNSNRALPLCSKCTFKQGVAVIGPNSDVTDVMIGNYFGRPCGYTTPLQGISQYTKTVHENGCATVTCNDNNQFWRAEIAAQRADATILVMGLSQEIEREGLDRVDLLLPGHQQELVSRVARASSGPVVLVLMSGGPIDVTFAIQDPKISAILWVGYPGQAGGSAIADVIFGAINPGGRLPMTWYPQGYLAHVPMTDMGLRPDPSRAYPGRTYKFYNGPVVFKFGFGLSYTNFKHTLAHGPKQVSISLTSNSETNTTKAMTTRVSHASCEASTFGLEIDVENIGEIDGPHTVMIFSSAQSMGKYGLEKKLIAFEKAHIVAGSKERVGLRINPCEHLSIVDEYGRRRMAMGEHSLQIGEDLIHTITLRKNVD